MIGNSAVTPVGSTGQGNGGGAGAPAGSPSGSTGQGGSVLGASTTPTGFGAGEVAMLPEVGASQPVDVSALRAAWHPARDTSAASKFVDRANAISVGMLATAAVLSLLGAIASAVYARRKEGKA
jgi:hypothetical protein